MKTISQIKPKKKSTALRELREQADLTLREMASYSEIPSPTISRIERGKQPDLRTALKIARFFETTVEELFGAFGA